MNFAGRFSCSYVIAVIVFPPTRTWAFVTMYPSSVIMNPVPCPTSVLIVTTDFIASSIIPEKSALVDAFSSSNSWPIVPSFEPRFLSSVFACMRLEDISVILFWESIISVLNLS